MPLAVTHILIPAILADIYRDHFAKKKFSLHYVYIAGLAGLLLQGHMPLFPSCPQIQCFRAFEVQPCSAPPNNSMPV